MPTPQSSQVSVIDPLTPAFDRVKAMLFQPFDLSRWIVIGFAAWLAQLGRHTNGGVGFHSGGDAGAHVAAAVRNARDYFVDNLHWMIPAIIVVGFLMLAIFLVLTWLSSRGQFMLLHCVATNRAEAAFPWTRFAQHGNSLFLFRAVLGILSFLLVLPFIFIALWNILQLQPGDPRVVIVMVRLGLCVAAIAGVILVYVLARKLTLDFVVPIMALQTASCTEGWRKFLSLLFENKVSFLLYILFSIVIALATGAIVVALVILTCCLAGCLLAIPFVGTVLLLPVHIFVRSYSLYYLAQHGPEWDVFAQPGGLPPQT
jgi:hypothetical protein